MAKKLTVQQEYKKALKNLERRIKRQVEKGYNVSRETLQSLLPKEKQRYSRKDIEKVKGIKAKQIKQVSTYEPPATEESELPTFDYVSAIVDIVSMLPNSIYVVRPRHDLDLTPYKNKILNMLYDTLAEYDNEVEYNKYLGSVYSEIQDNLNVNTFDSSSEEEITQQFTRALTLIKGKALTMEEALIGESFSEL